MLIAGVCFFAYPTVIKLVFDAKADVAIDDFNDIKGEYQELKEAMIKYNEDLYADGQSGLIDQLSYEEPSFKLSDYGIDSQILGYIEIPSIEVKLPIYNGASEENMTKGAAYLANTSLPVGGNNTNCVIAGHTRWNGIYMFKRITELKLGDEILVSNLWETLVYKVSETKIIEPIESENIYIKEGRNMLTLTTCHPFPENYQRYLVYADYFETVETE